VATFIIAEIGSVHDGSFGNALKLIDAAADCGVDAVKFQTHIPEAETLPDAPVPQFFRDEPRFEYFRRTSFTLDQWSRLVEKCEERGVVFMSSPFSNQAVDLLERLAIQQYKIPSGEVTNLPMLEKVAQLKKPIILSSGMSSWSELDLAVETISKHHKAVTVLQCTSEYPCDYDRVGLNVMLEMRDRYHLPIGLSDHTLTPYASFAAVSLGASVIEKHFTFSRKMYGSDARHSLEPEELANLVRGIRAIETMLASPVHKDDTSPLAETKRIFEKSIVTTSNIPARTVITAEMLDVKKPGTGLPARRLHEFVGRKAAHDIPANRLLSESDVLPA
jgi:N,N'-diacetyllegionaminate synthase